MMTTATKHANQRAARLLVALSAIFLFAAGRLAHASGPKLAVGSASGVPGATVTVPVTFDSGSSAVSAIQFNLILPPTLSTGAVTAGPILAAASKSASSVFRAGTWKIIIFGLNRAVISGGNLLTLSLQISPSAHPGKIKLRITHAIFSDGGGSVVPPGKSSGGLITVSAN